ncbi:BnaC07g13520D [Brassica napus]|uniref:BnaC07g13520D protein n=1 Tax=Brassica napus TaxID=3708 RepID=A0A078FHT5_BRANA|nr:BnaC07g13520D [Brassica napus]
MFLARDVVDEVTSLR